MSTFPAHFIADLRHPIGYPDLDAGQWFQWRSIPLIELSALDTYQFVQSMLLQPAQTIVEVGCGNSYLSFGSARDGHEVTGIDESPENIKVVVRSSAAHPQVLTDVHDLRWVTDLAAFVERHIKRVA